MRHPAPETTRRAVAIGGSLGSIKAVRSVLSALPADLPAPVFIVIHVGAVGRNMLAGALDQAGPLAVVTAEDGAPAEPGICYVAPADGHLLVLDGTIRIGHGPRENMSRPSIDPLFRSAALTYGSGVTAVLLSGLLNDGVAGLDAVHRCGGVTVVQNPADAEANEMPLSALAAQDIDFRGDADRIGGMVVAILAAEREDRSCDPPDVRLEVDIALGRPFTGGEMMALGAPSEVSCPACGGVLTQMHRPPLRFRCQVGHAYTAEALETQTEGSLDEAMRVALRIIAERAALAEKMAQHAYERGMRLSAGDYAERAEEYRTQAATLQSALLKAAARDPEPA